MVFSDSFQNFLHSVNSWWGSKRFRFDVIDRELYLKRLLPTDQKTKHNHGLVKILIGARRVGKTTILQSTINRLLRRVDNQKIVYLPADLRDIRENGIKSTLEFYAKNFHIDLFKDEVHVFIDEVQELEGWQKDIKLLYDNTKIRFYLTGSSSLVLAKDTSKLTGRFLLQHVLPLNFSEFKLFNKTKKKSEKKLLEEYLEIGGYPEYVLNRNKVYLKQAIESTLYRELLDYYGIKNPAILNDLLELLADKITSPVSASRISHDLKINDKTAKFYLDYLKSVYLIYPVYRFGQSHRISKSSIPKYYFNDTGVLSLFGIRTRIGHIVENSVFLHLLYQQITEENPRIFYDVIDGQEVDFRVSDKLYEVKGHNDLEESDLARYEVTGKKVKVVYHGAERDLQKRLFLPNLEYVSLRKFLAEK